MREHMTDFSFDDSEHVSLCEVLDRILNKGAVVVGEVVISVANIDLIYLGLQVILTSIDTAHGMKNKTCMMEKEISNEYLRSDESGV
jgi:hypothetical protein